MYVFQTNNAFNMLSNWITPLIEIKLYLNTWSYSWSLIIYDKMMYSHTIIVVGFKIYVHKNHMHTFQRKCRTIHLLQLQTKLMVYIISWNYVKIWCGNFKCAFMNEKLWQKFKLLLKYMLRQKYLIASYAAVCLYYDWLNIYDVIVV